MITFTVRGLPAPQGSKRLLPRGARRGGVPIMVESSKRVPKWRRAIRDEARRAMELLEGEAQRPRTGAIGIRIEFRMPRPKGHWLPANSRRPIPVLRDRAPTRPVGKPDADKLARAVLDAITGVVIADDALVVDLHASKVYANEHREVGAEIRVTDLAAVDAAIAPSGRTLDWTEIDEAFEYPMLGTPLDQAYRRVGLNPTEGD